MLFWQLVATPLLPGRVWRVAKGSGIGQPMSGELSDLCYYNSIEAKFLHCLEKWGVRCWFRYRDDIFAVMDGDRPTRRRFFHYLRSISCSLYPYKLESVGKSVTMLCVTVLSLFRALEPNGYTSESLGSAPRTPPWSRVQRSAHSSSMSHRPPPPRP